MPRICSHRRTARPYFLVALLIYVLVKRAFGPIAPVAWRAFVTFAPVALIALPIVLFILYTRSFARSIFAWRRNARLIGATATRRGAWLMMRLAYREPWLSMEMQAPGVSLLLCALLAGWIQIQYAWSPFWVVCVVLWTLLSLAPSLEHLYPPVVLWLSASDYEQFAVLKNLQKLVPLGVKTLMHQAAPGVLKRYHWHYLQGYERRATYATGGTRWRARAALAIVPFILRPHTPRTESLRTRPRLWEQTVLDLIEFVRIVIIDARVVTGPVCQEIGWMMAPERQHKTIFLVDDLGKATELNTALRQLGHVTTGNALVVNEKILYDVVRDMTKSSDTLPKPGDAHWIEKVHTVIATLKALVATLTDPTQSDREIDARIWSWDTQQPLEQAIGGQVPPVTSSVDAALALAKTRMPHSSLSLHMSTNGTAWADIGVLDENEQYNVSASAREDNLTPARALLQALLRAELGWRKAPEQPLEQAVWEQLPPVTSSVDTALALAKTRMPHSSLNLYVSTNGTAWADIGVLDENGQYRVSASAREDNLTPARALLQALLRAENIIQ